MVKLSKAMSLGFFLIGTTLLAACGGGGGEQAASFGATTSSTSTSSSTSTAASTSSTAATTTTVAGPTTTTTLPPGALTVLDINSLSGAQQNNVPVTFGQVFAIGDIPAGQTVAGSLDGAPLTLQVDAKAQHADGSLRHAVISTVVPQMNAGQNRALFLSSTAASSGAAPLNALSQLLGSGFTASVNATIGGLTYSVSAETLLGTGTPAKWLSGPLVNEWLVSAPLKTAGGVEHPHLTARFAIRSYYGQNKAKVDVILENGWAYEPNPQDITYNVQINVGGQLAYSQTALTHYHHARWRKSFWWGAAPQTHLKHQTAYLIGSRAVPNYDQSVTVSHGALANLKSSFDASSNGPMGNGIATAYMPTTGGRIDIGMIPGWGAMTILSMDKRAKDVTLAMGDLAGSWPTHYRDKTTGRPISLIDYPNMTLYPASSDSFNTAANRQEAMPNCTTVCNNPNVPDTDHQPAFNYLPYVLTGEHYYLEELQFYSMWNLGKGAPVYREYGKGLVYASQIRGQAWMLRNLADAAYILPNSDPLKAHFNTLVANNIAWFNTNFTNNASANSFGAITTGYAFAYNGETGIAPWQDDFFTSIIGHAAERGFAGAPALLAWKAKFPVSRMTDPGYCWILGSIYAFNMRPTNASPLYTTFSQAYQASTSTALQGTACGSAAMAGVLQTETGTPMVAGAMVGYPTSPTGFPANMQPALAYAKDSGIANAANAWNIFSQRLMKPDYSTEPQFAIVPR